MKSFLTTFLLILILASTSNLVAQGSLYLNPSPLENGLGMTGTSLPNEDPAGFYYNPAELGYISQTNNISWQVYPSGANWLGNNADIKYQNTSFNIGYNFKQLLGGLNLSAGFGYIHSNYDMSSGTLFSRQDERYNAYGFGVGIDYFVQFNIGITYKNTTLYNPLVLIMAGYPYIGNEAKSNAIDYGILLTVPITKLISPDLQFPVLDNIPILPYLNFSTGYAQLNVGKAFTFANDPFPEPLPRTARLGYTISAGFNIKLNNSTIQALGYDFTVYADDDLVNYSPFSIQDFQLLPPSSYTYKNFLGDIIIGKNLIDLKGANGVIVHKGNNIDLFETVSFQTGRFNGSSIDGSVYPVVYDNDKSSGFGVQLKGIFTLLKGFTKDKTFYFIADHLNIQYYSSTLFEGISTGTKFKGINLIWSGMTL